jgi:enterochelin esterase family protein
MKHRPALVIVSLLALGTLSTSSVVRAQSATILAQPTEPTLDGPRLAALWQELQAGNAAALDSFWLEIKGKAPLVEPNPEDPTMVRVTFIHHGSSTTRSIFLEGGLPDSPADKQLARLGDTNLWYRTERLPPDSRFYYDFGVLSGSATQPSYGGDVLNPGGGEAELPGVPPLPWNKYLPGVPHGKLMAQHLQSQLLNAARSFSVYTPPGYDPNGSPYGLLVLFDGEAYRDTSSIPGLVILDNLTAKQQISPLVAVLVNTQNGTRHRDLANSPLFADFVAEELIPWVRQNYHVSTDLARTIVGGYSLGGLMSSYCGFRHPEVFGNVLSQSGSYWVFEGWPAVSTSRRNLYAAPLETESGWLTRRFATTPKLALRFYLSVGRLEDAAMYQQNPALTLENRRLRDVLEAKGYPVTYEEVNSDHSELNWRSTLANGLMALDGLSQPQ